jgi:hypothetical protein
LPWRTPIRMLTLAATLNLVTDAQRVSVDIYDAMKPFLSGMSQIWLLVHHRTSGNDCPHSKNCMKYNRRCPYLDIPENEQQESILIRANLLWTSDVETEVLSWQQVGRSSFPSLCVFPAIPFENFSLEDLRLIHHIASISGKLSASNRSNFTIWVKQVPL